MPPAPKDPKVRRRRNKSPSRARLQAVGDDYAAQEPAKGRSKKPAYPQLPPGRFWHPQTVEWWEHVWSSPMAGEILKADVDQLFVLAVLMDKFWQEPSKELAAEIRQQRQAFGLTPLDRRRLEWEIERSEAAQRKAPPGRAKKSTAKDPRDALTAVK